MIGGSGSGSRFIASRGKLLGAIHHGMFFVIPRHILLLLFVSSPANHCSCAVPRHHAAHQCRDWHTEVTLSPQTPHEHTRKRREEGQVHPHAEAARVQTTKRRRHCDEESRRVEQQGAKHTMDGQDLVTSPSVWACSFQPGWRHSPWMFRNTCPGVHVQLESVCENGLWQCL